MPLSGLRFRHRRDASFRTLILSRLTPTGPRWTETRRAAFEHDGWRCRACGRPGRLEAHHVRSLARGGDPFDLENLETLCRPCHIERHRRKLSPGEAAWRALVDDLLGDRTLP